MMKRPISLQTEREQMLLPLSEPPLRFEPERAAEATPAVPGPLFSNTDRHFARFIERLNGVPDPALALAAALVSQRREQGHVCLDLPRVAGAELRAEDEGKANRVGGEVAVLRCPELNPWLAALRASPVVGAPGEMKPLILESDGRLYLHRYWQYEATLAEQLRRRANEIADDVDWTRASEGLRRLFGAGEADRVDWQKLAVFTALRQKFCIISGGPGTGKTRTVVRLLALLLEQAGQRRPRLALAAPTGKAAARLQEALQNARAQLPCADTIRQALPEQASTLHRLLGARPGSSLLTHGAANPLALEALVVDEASMVDLALMAKLFEALPPPARVVLVGDKDQLASVEAGAVLGDLCAPTQVNHFSSEFRAHYRLVTEETLPEPIRAEAAGNCIVQLQKNYRFGDASPIQILSRAINDGDASATLKWLRECGGASRGVTWRPLPAPLELKAALREHVLGGYADALQAADPIVALEQLNRFRLLAAIRRGPYGVAHLNQVAEEILADAAVLAPEAGPYARRPILVTHNDYNLKVFNGDVGLILRDQESQDLRACFLGPEGVVRKLSPWRLPEHETVFATTVHKSQGSEFERVLVILPETMNPVLTRELLYTAVTRASQALEVWSNEAVLAAAIAAPVRRTSGLRERLWSAATGGRGSSPASKV